MEKNYELKITRAQTPGTSRLEQAAYIADAIFNVAKKFGDNSYVVVSSTLNTNLWFAKQFKKNVFDCINGPYISGKLCDETTEVVVVVDPFVVGNEFVFCSGDGLKNLPVVDEADLTKRLSIIESAFAKDTVGFGLFE